MRTYRSFMLGMAFCFAIFLALLTQQAALAATIYVTPTGGGNGSTWPLATTLQDALEEADSGVTATFTQNGQNSYTLTINKVGSGDVTKSPDQATYLAGTVVNLTAIAATGFTFTGWSGACTGTGACAVTMDAAKSVRATFTRNDTPGNDAPDITSLPIISATVGTAYTYAFIAVDPDTGDTLTLSTPTKPSWLTLTATGNGTATLAGTPALTDVGENAVQLRVQDAAGLFTLQEFTIIVVADDPTQTGTVQGVVKDADGNVVEGAEVTLTSANGEVVVAVLLTDITDSDGVYIFEGVPFGEYTISIRFPGMADSDPNTITVQAGETTIVPTITLQPSESLIHLPMLSK